MNRIRGFELVPERFREHMFYPDLPKRSSEHSAGYDLYSPWSCALRPGETLSPMWLDIRAYMQPGEFLMVVPRSSLGKKGLRLLNTVGIIDADYYDNSNNAGNIGLMLENVGDETIIIDRGDRIAQAIFMPFLVADDDDAGGKGRDGGFGSSGR